MSSSGKGGASSQGLVGRKFYIVQSKTTAAERAQLKNLILSNGGEIVEAAIVDAISIVTNPAAIKMAPQLLSQHAYLHSIYKDDVVQALIDDPNALDDEEYIYMHKEGRDILEADDEPLASVGGVGGGAKARGTDRRRLYQPDVEHLPEPQKAFLSKSEQEYLSETYINPALIDPDITPIGTRYVKSIRIPPPLPGAPPSKRRADEGEQVVTAAGERLKHLFYAPPLALNDCVRAADPAERNFMTSEDFAILMWYVRTIPYCGAEATKDQSKKERYEYSAYRWNWARTHGICLRPLTSIQERWRRYILPLFQGATELPEGTFRTFCAQSGFFLFCGNYIVAYNPTAIRQANAKCLEDNDIDPATDPYTIPTERDKEHYARSMKKLQESYPTELHEGKRWIPEEDD